MLSLLYYTPCCINALSVISRNRTQFYALSGWRSAIHWLVLKGNGFDTRYTKGLGIYKLLTASMLVSLRDLVDMGQHLSH